MMTYREMQFSSIARGGKDGRYSRIREYRESHVAAKIRDLVSDGAREIESTGYYVTPSGDVYSTNRRRFIKLRPGVKPGGYEFVGIRTDTVRYEMVHRLVAKAFLPNPRQLPAVNHRDGDKRNNHVGNLEWVSHAENSRHAKETGLMPADHPKRKLTHAQVREIRALQGKYKDIAKVYGICAQNVCNIKRGKTYRNVA